MSEILNHQYPILAEPIVDSVNGFKRITYPFQPNVERGHASITVKAGYENYDWHIALAKRRTYVTGSKMEDLHSYLSAYNKMLLKKTTP